jgi:hypothetical protein
MSPLNPSPFVILGSSLAQVCIIDKSLLDLTTCMWHQLLQQLPRLRQM